MILSLLLGLFQLVQQDLPTPQVINTQNGLSNNIVYETFHDSHGFIWIATDNGLNRFDGYDFRTFYHDSEDTTTISGNIVRSILEDQSGNLWVGTFDGLNLYNPKTESFTRFKTFKSLPNERLDIQHMAIDKRGKIWINSLRTIGWFDTHSLEFGFADIDYSSSTMAIDGQDRVWTSSKNGTIDRVASDGSGFISQVEFDNSDQQPLYWGGFSQSLWIKEPHFKEAIEAKTSILPALPNDTFARELLETDANTLWIGTEIGLFIYYKNQDILAPIKLGNSNTLTSAIRSIDMDRNGGIWVGTLGGLFHFDPFQKPFEHIDLVESMGDVIMGMEKVSEKMYINALGNGLYEYDLNTGASKRLMFKGSPPLGFDFIWTIKSVPNSSYPIWLATDAGLLLYNPTNGRWKDTKLYVSNNTLNPSFSIFETKGDFNWVSAQKGVHLLRKYDGKVVKSISLAEFTKESIIQDLCQINDQLIIATEGVGTIVYNLKSEEVKLLSEIVEEAQRISSITTWQLFEDAGHLWLATNRGLFYLNTSTWQLSEINVDGSLDNSIIFSIEKDTKGVLWMGTERGLISYDPISQKAYHYSEKDGLKNIEFNRKSVKKVANGQLYFGGVSGITHFHPDRIQQNTIVPQLHIKNIEIITSDSTFSAQLNEKNQLVLPWHQNTVQIDYVAINYTNPEQNQYRYQLTGHDPDWVKGESSRQARYVKLPPGDYEFQLMASNNDGLWNPDVKSFIIIIKPPFWQTWWFRSLILLTIALILYAIYRYRVKRLLEVERMKLRIAGDLHDEVGSGLSGIALTGDLLKRQVNNGGAKPELVERITKNARNLASSLDSIVWLIDPQKESLGDFLIKTRAVASELLAEIKFEMEEELTEVGRSKTLTAEQKRNLFLLTKEGLNNIAKHANASKVALSINYNPSVLTLKISDNGKGFDLAKVHTGHGLGSMKHRAEQLKGDINFESTKQGTEISLTMKLP